MPMMDVYAPDDLFPPGADSQLVAELAHAVLRAEGVTTPGPFHLDNTEIVAKISGDLTQAARTWVILTEAAEGGWGLAGTAFGQEEFGALAAKAAAAKAEQ